MKEYYDNGKLNFEGEHINFDKNGKGKKYYKNGNVMFEGEYFYNMQWNGKGYDVEGNIIYELNNGNYIFNKVESEGDYLFGTKYRKWKEYNDDGILIFEGEYLNGYKQGLGKEYDNGKLIFEGEYLYNYKRKGKQYDCNGKLIFEGEYLYNKQWNGKGYDINGNILNVLKNGNGKVKEYCYFNYYI